MKEIGIKEEQIIQINLEDADYDFAGYKELYKYINDKIDSNKQYYIFLDEVQNVVNFQKIDSNTYLLSG